MPQTISRDQLKQMLESNQSVTLVESMPEDHFQQAHIPGAIRIGADEVESKASQLLPDKNAMIVTYCASPECTASETTAEKLSSMGYANVKEYAEGKSDWQSAGFPTESGPAALNQA